MLRKTKIIATLGPVSESAERLAELIEAGVNVFRLNMSHATHDWVREIVPRIRKVAQELGKPTGILMDTQGPAIRTGDLPTKLDLKVGDIMEFTVHGAVSVEHFSVDVNYDGLINDINVGDVVLVDNGVMHMKVLEKKDNKIRCEVLTPGLLGSRRHINLPGVKVNLPPLTSKDLADIEVGVQVGVDFFALSFCREPSDVLEFRRVLREHGVDTPIIAKIEDQSAVREIDAIIEAADIIMVARGDLGIECPLEELPIIQRRIAKHCIAIGRPVIVATHMLESMIENPGPTRAEITDIANAVFEEADAIMLSGETTVGKYPVECVRIFDRVAKRIERSGGAGYAIDAIITDPRHKMVKSAVVLANSFPNSKLVIFTRRGIMATYASQLRPEHSPIFAFSPDDIIVRRMALNRATHAIRMAFDIRPEHTVADAESHLLKMGLVKSGDRLIVVSDIRAGDERFDSVHLREIP
ncbi:MAG: pyruvate kinase [Chthoniobacterales bacterium]